MRTHSPGASIEVLKRELHTPVLKQQKYWNNEASAIFFTQSQGNISHCLTCWPEYFCPPTLLPWLWIYLDWYVPAYKLEKVTPWRKRKYLDKPARLTIVPDRSICQGRYKTLPKAQRTRGLSSYHNFWHKSWSNFNFRNLTKLKLKIFTKPSFRILDKIQLRILTKPCAQSRNKS